jgi:hypothetical protein
MRLIASSSHLSPPWCRRFSQHVSANARACVSYLPAAAVLCLRLRLVMSATGVKTAPIPRTSFCKVAMHLEGRRVKGRGMGRRRGMRGMKVTHPMEMGVEAGGQGVEARGERGREVVGGGGRWC